MTEPSESEINQDVRLLSPARKARREVYLGLFVLLALGAILLALFTMTSPSLLRGHYVVAALMDDAGGIRRGDPVQLRGVNIGRVRRFELRPDNVAIYLEIEGAYKVPRDSRVYLKPGGILGDMITEIEPGTSSEPLKGGDTMPGSRGEKIGDKASHLAERSNEVLSQMHALLSDRTVKNVENGTADLSELLASLAELVEQQRVELDGLSRSLRLSAERVEHGQGTLGRLVRDDTLYTTLNDAAASTSQTAREVAALGKDAAQALASVQRATTNFDAMTKNAGQTLGTLNRAAAELGLLTKDIRENPKRYLRFSVF